MDRHKDDPQCLNQGRVLPVLSTQKMNSYLKEIADACDIKKKMTFHTARHTFATTFTLANDVPMETVSKLLGHRNLKTTQHYGKILDLNVSQDMGVLRAKFFRKISPIREFKETINNLHCKTKKAGAIRPLLLDGLPPCFSKALPVSLSVRNGGVVCFPSVREAPGATSFITVNDSRNLDIGNLNWKINKSEFVNSKCLLHLLLSFIKSLIRLNLMQSSFDALFKIFHGL
jgi:hypothetical protein